MYVCIVKESTPFRNGLASGGVWVPRVRVRVRWRCGCVLSVGTEQTTHGSYCSLCACLSAFAPKLANSTRALCCRQTVTVTVYTAHARRPSTNSHGSKNGHVGRVRVSQTRHSVLITPQPPRIAIVSFSKYRQVCVCLGRCTPRTAVQTAADCPHGALVQDWLLPYVQEEDGPIPTGAGTADRVVPLMPQAAARPPRT